MKSFFAHRFDGSFIRFSIYFFLSFVVFSMVSSCSKDDAQAENSIEGIWDVTEILSQYGETQNNGFISSETISESGELGFFDFTNNSAEFEFTRNDTLFAGSGTWNITAEKVNSGFTRVTEFTLTVDDHFLFDVFFEDGTKNSEKNAKKATFTQTPTTNGLGVIIVLSLEKR